MQKVKINNESLFEIRYVQYFTPQQLLPLFADDKNKMQTRIQLIDARDSRGNKLPRRESLRLLQSALRNQASTVDVVLMPDMSKNEADLMLENLKYATTLA